MEYKKIVWPGFHAQRNIVLCFTAFPR